MTDRELLELAAEAAGLDYIKPADGYSGRLGLEVGSNPMRTQSWNPLNDDGDALRLAVKLNLTIHQWADGPCVCNYAGTVNGSVRYGDDKYAATRRAIVMAAAEIGERGGV